MPERFDQPIDNPMSIEFMLDRFRAMLDRLTGMLDLYPSIV